MESVRKLAGLTSSAFNETVDFLTGIHGTKVELFDNRSCVVEFWCVVWWRGELFYHFSSDSCSGLFHADDGTVTRVALDEENHLFISHQDIVSTNVIQPSLHGGFDACFIFGCPNTCRCQRWGQCRYKGFWIGGDEMVGKFCKLRVRASNVSELSSPESWQIGLGFY